MWHTGLEKQPHTTSGKETVDSCAQQWRKFVRQVNWMETWAEEMSRYAMSKWTYIMTCSLSWVERKWSQQGLRSSDNTLRKTSVCCFPNSSNQICRMTTSLRESRQKIEYRAWTSTQWVYCQMWSWNQGQMIVSEVFTKKYFNALRNCLNILR